MNVSFKLAFLFFALLFLSFFLSLFIRMFQIKDLDFVFVGYISNY
jgi:hypothetical protein